MTARDKILIAIRELVLSEPWDDFSTLDVISRAGVARSTFYAQFKGKNDLLLASMGPILTVMRETCRGTVESATLQATLEHLWENRYLGRVFFQPPMSVRLTREMVSALESEGVESTRSHFLVNGLMGTLGAWTAGQLPSSVEELKAALPDLIGNP